MGRGQGRVERAPGKMWILASGQDSLAKWTGPSSLISDLRCFPTRKRMDSQASFTQGCPEVTCTRKGFYRAKQKGFIKDRVI